MTEAFDSLRHLVLPDAPLRDRTLLDHRVADEQARQAIERRPIELAGKIHEGSPAVPGAQLVYSIEKARFGIAVQGFPHVVMLPKGYEGQGLELAYLGKNTFLVRHPTQPTLTLEPPGRLRQR